ncbi:MAG: hypothetical protein IT260_16035 [Saprospiraceae bacterium]|nr:hypothetical protein [Saprospiraceae bacterium]
MSKIRFLSLLVVALVLLDLIAAALFFSGKLPPPRREGPRRVILERLHFNEQQTAAYDKLIAAHRSAIRQKQDEMATAKQQLYAQLAGDSFPQKDSLIAHIGRLQQEIEQIHFSHFQDIKGLCQATVEQDEAFRALAGELGQYFGPPRHKKQ